MNCPICSNKEPSFFLSKDGLKFFICSKCRVIFQENYEIKENSSDYGKENILNHYDYRFLTRYIGGGKILERFRKAQYNEGFLTKYFEQIDYVGDGSSDLGVLDVGGGTGENLHALKNTSVFKDKKCVLMERSRIDRDIGEVLYGLDVVADFSELAHERFPVITIHHVLEHIPNPNEFISMLKKHLSGNGFVFLTTPDPFAWYPKLRRAKWGWFMGNHLVLYSMSACRQLFEQHGFELVAEKKYFLYQPFSITYTVLSTLFSVVRNHSLPRVLQDAYAQIYQVQTLDN